MQVSVRADRTIQQYGAFLGDIEGCALEEVSDTTYQAVVGALGQVQSGGCVTLSPDHDTVRIVPPSPEDVAADAARQAEQEALRAAVAAHPDPVVQALAKRLGLI